MGCLMISFLVYGDGMNSIAVTFKVKGKADLKKVAENVFKKLSRGTLLDSGDRVKTGDDGFVALVFADDQSQLKLRANTEIAIEGKREGRAISKTVNMQIGKLLVDIKKQRGEFKIATPTSVASVKGTIFYIILDAQGNTWVTTLEGLVELYNNVSGVSVTVVEGETGQSDPEGNLSVDPTSPEVLEELGEMEEEEPEEEEIEIEFEEGILRIRLRER